MKLKYTIAALAATTLAANASTVIVDSLPTSTETHTPTGQTFTTGVLGTDNKLSEIDIMGSHPGDSSLVYTAEIWTDTDGDFATWDPGDLVARSTNSLSFDSSGVYTFNFDNEVLKDNEVYVLSFHDGTKSHAGSASSLVCCSSTAGSLPDGSWFSGGAKPCCGTLDLPMRVTTVPEPSSAALLGLGGLALVLRRRK